MIQPRTPLEEQIEAAFDYRGHVTVSLTDGRTVEGFLFNRAFEGTKGLDGPPWVELMLKGSGERARYPIADIEEVALSGKDHAEG